MNMASIPFATTAQWILGIILVLSSIGVITFRKPVHACLSFLLTLLALAALYLQLSAEFIAVIQILAYAGAILVIFMFVIILFQDAHERIEEKEAQSSLGLRMIALAAFSAIATVLAMRLTNLLSLPEAPPLDFGSVHAIGKTLYIDFFFPFETIVVVFLIAIVGALYIGKKERIVIKSEE